MNIDAIFNMHKVRFAKLAKLFKEVEVKSVISSVNVFINIEAIYHMFHNTPMEESIVSMDKQSRQQLFANIISNTINLAAHYRLFFTKNKIATNIIYYYNDPDSYYKYNNKHKNNALYTNRALYSPKIRFFKGNSITTCDIITCAAPNYYAAKKYLNIDTNLNSKALKQRIKFVLDIAEYKNVDTLILGAFGCGVFGQDPREVATIFNEELKTHNFNKIIFAIPSGHNDNYDWFNKIL